MKHCQIGHFCGQFDSVSLYIMFPEKNIWERRREKERERETERQRERERERERREREIER